MTDREMLEKVLDDFDLLMTELDIVANDIKVGDVYSIHTGVSESNPSDYEQQSIPRRWNGNYTVVGFNGPDIFLENVGTKEIDFMRSEFLITWQKVKDGSTDS